MDLFFSIAIPAVLVVTGAVMVFMALRNRRQAEESTGWFPASGEVTSSTMKKYYRKGGVDYEPRIEYTYMIMGTPYSGKRLCFGALRTNETKAMQKLSQYPLHGKLVVYYNPDKPTESVVERIAPATTRLIVTGGLISLAGVVTLFLPYLQKIFGF